MNLINNHYLVTIGLPIVKIDFLDRAIESCLNQTYVNFELVILNNAKNFYDRNEIRNLIENYTDSRIKYFENDSQIPMVVNWNKVLQLASGHYFSLLCDDDVWHPDFLVEMVSLALKYPLCSIFHSRVISIDQFGNPIGISPICPEYEDGIDFIYHRILGFRNFYLSDFMVLTSDLKSIGGFIDLPDGWGSDDITWFKLAMKGGIGYSKNNLFYYRISDLNVSNNKRFNRKIEAVEKQVLMIKEVLDSFLFPEDFRLDFLKKELNNFKNHRIYTLRFLYLNKVFKIPFPLAKIISLLFKHFNK